MFIASKIRFSSSVGRYSRSSQLDSSRKCYCSCLTKFRWSHEFKCCPFTKKWQGSKKSLCLIISGKYWSHIWNKNCIWNSYKYPYVFRKPPKTIVHKVLQTQIESLNCFRSFDYVSAGALVKRTAHCDAQWANWCESRKRTVSPASASMLQMNI